MSEQNTTPDGKTTDGTAAESTESTRATATRRGAMALAGLVGFGITGQSVSAAQDGRPYYNWREDVDARGHALEDLESMRMSGSDVAIRAFDGENLTVENGVLQATAGAEQWADETGDGLLETLDHNGISVPSVVAGHVRSKETPVWDVTAHGIVGDGETHVGTAVNELLTEVAAAGGGVVYFPPGRYVFERTPLIGDDTFVMGAGRATVWEGYRPDGVSGEALIAHEGLEASGYDGASNWGIYNVRIDSPDTNGIVTYHTENVYLGNLYGSDAYHHFVDVAGCRNVVTENLYLKGSGTAPHQIDTIDSSNNIWDGSRSVEPNRDGTITRNVTVDSVFVRPESPMGEGAIHVHRSGHVGHTIRNVWATDVTEAVYTDPDTHIEDLTIRGVYAEPISAGVEVREGDGSEPRNRITVADVVVKGSDLDSGVFVANADDVTVSNVSTDFEGTHGSAVAFRGCGEATVDRITTYGDASDAVEPALRYEDSSGYVHGASVTDWGGDALAADAASADRVAYSGLFETNTDGISGAFRPWNQS